MPSQLCIHGHFYQPPRENPWLGGVFPEPSAAPAPDWNDRILRESYRPLAYARRMDGRGRILEILNCYEWMNFNVGPTLNRWMQENAPDTLRRIVEGDKASVARLGHGNAIAQCYHHIILPLATDEERRLQVAWAVLDFTERFGRKPEGIWLSEAAVDTPTLETLAEQGIRFTVLAPSQAKAVGGLTEPSTWVPVTEWSLDISRPYRVDLPSGRSVAVFFYDGAISQAVAFERLLSDGESFWRKLSERARGKEGLLSLGTDGETYGHHFKFGEMALAHVLAKAREGADGVRITNFSAYLAQNPPKERVVLHEPSSWSCAHGVERWASDCGCTNGDHPGWNQRWRSPLRAALRSVKNMLDAHFASAGGRVFRASPRALLEYGRVLAAPHDERARTLFMEEHFLPDLTRRERDSAWQLLAMQEAGMASFASCAWFFDEISRIEPLNALTFALRAMELAATTGARVDTGEMLNHLERAISNKPEEGTGKDLFLKRVAPRSITPGKLTLTALCGLYGSGALPEPGQRARQVWPEIEVEVELKAGPPGPEPSASASGALAGECSIKLPLEERGRVFAFSWLPPDRSVAHPLDTSVVLNSVLGDEEQPALYVHVDEQKRACSLTDPCREGEVAYGRDLPAGARQLLIGQWLAAGQEKINEKADRLARFLLGFLPALESEQRELPWTHLWSVFSVHVLPAVLDNPDLLEYAGPYLHEFIQAKDLSPRQMELRRRLVTEHLRADLAEYRPDWQALIRKCEVLRGYMPDADLWEIQNALWPLRDQCAGNPDAAHCFGVYGFAPTSSLCPL